MENSDSAELVDLVVGGYRIRRKIGGGNWGDVYLGSGPMDSKVAIKVENKETKCPQLRHEYKIYRELVGCKGFCSIYYFTSSSIPKYTILIMSVLGPSLEDLFMRCNQKFSLQTVVLIADQILERMETFQSRYLIHRDIKPSNFCIGSGELKDYIFMVDFGMSKRFCDPHNHFEHIPYQEGRALTGTPRYASINNHLGITPSRRDDLEAVGYMLIYFLKGRLPWQGLLSKTQNNHKYDVILQKKQKVSLEQLCEGSPRQFIDYLKYTRDLKFEEAPDFTYLRQLFHSIYEEYHFSSTSSSSTSHSTTHHSATSAATTHISSICKWDWDHLHTDTINGVSSDVDEGDEDYDEDEDGDDDDEEDDEDVEGGEIRGTGVSGENVHKNRITGPSYSNQGGGLTDDELLNFRHTMVSMSSSHVHSPTMHTTVAAGVTGITNSAIAPTPGMHPHQSYATYTHHNVSGHPSFSHDNRKIIT